LRFHTYRMACRLFAVSALLGSATALHLHTGQQRGDDAPTTEDLIEQAKAELSNEELIEQSDREILSFGLPDDPWKQQYPPRGETSRPRMLAMRGCSGSSAVMVFARSLLRFHGIPVSRAAEPRMNDKGKPISPLDKDALPAELLNPKINWLYYNENNNIGKAMLRMNKNVNARNQTLFFKGMVQHMQGDGWGADEWKDLKGSFKNMNMYALLGSRTNMLDQVICQVKDCFQDKYGEPVKKVDGSKSDLCFNRRGEQGNPTAANTKQALVNNKHEAGTILESATELEIAMNDSAWFWSGDDEYQAKLNIDNLMESIDMEFQVVANAKKNLQSIGVKFETVAEEDLLEFQTDEEGAFERGVNAWTKLLKSFGVEPSRYLVKEFLTKYAKTYHKSPAHWEVIYNYDDVKKALKGTRYDHLLRW